MKKRLFKFLIVLAGLLGIAAIVVVVRMIAGRPSAGQQAILADGSVLLLKRVIVAPKIEISHGNGIEKILGNVIPSNGVQFLNMKLNRRTRLNFDSSGNSWLVAEFKLSGTGATNHPLLKLMSLPGRRAFRYVIYGDDGFEYEQDLRDYKYRFYSDGCYGYLVTGRFPRSSPWMGIRLEQNDSLPWLNPWQTSHWKTVADFKIKNPARSVPEAWIAEPAPAIRSINSLDFVLASVTIKINSSASNDVWNVVTKNLEVRSNGVPLTNWVAAEVQMKDASGNFDFFASDGCLDPRYVWKVEANFQPLWNFPTQQVATVNVPYSTQLLVTNIAGVPVRFWWRFRSLNADIPSNRTNNALRFISLRDESGHEYSNLMGGKFPQGFWQNLYNYPTQKNVRVTLAVVTNIPVTFFTQPRVERADTAKPAL